MTWWGWVLLAAYIVGGLIAWPKIAYVIAHDGGSSYYGLGGLDILLGYLVAGFVVAAWPAVWVLYALFQKRKESLLVAPRAIRRREERERLQQRIADLERELSIR